MTNFFKKTSSINFINYTLFISLVYLNSFFFLSDRLYNYKVLYLSINLILLILFYISNKTFNIELNNRKNDIKKFIDNVLKDDYDGNEIKKLLLKKIFYKENEDTYKFFKNMYIKKNLLTKDYNDLKNIFLKFIPEKFYKELGEKGAEKISLGVSVKKHLNVMFLDIIGFSSISENMEPDRALLLLNIYYDGIVEIINQNGGYIDKFLGDGVMVIFDGNNSDNSVKAAIEIQDFIRKLQIPNTGREISVGIGINSGSVILGTIGSRKRMEITIIGDVVNTASRIEGLTRTNKDKVIISEYTYNTLSSKKDFSFKDLGIKTLKGKKIKIKLYGVTLKNKKTKTF